MKKIFLILTAGLLALTACSQYDDSTLNGRLDELDGRVDEIASELSKLTDRLNDDFAALQKLLNGGFVTSVKQTADGLEIEITNVDGTKETLTVSNGADGTDGADGADGKDGVDGSNGANATPAAVSVKYDPASGRYVWTIDGVTVKDADGNPVYATGEYGDGGLNGQTPTFVIAADKAGQPDFETVDGDMYWYVSYNETVLDKSEYEGAEWTKLGAFDGEVSVASGLLEVTYVDGILKFVQSGKVLGEFAVVSEYLDVTLMMDGEELEEHEGTAHFYNGAKKTITVDVKNASKNAFVKAAFMKTKGEFSTYIDGMNITVTANASGASDILRIAVLDGDICYNTYVNLAVDVPTLRLYSTRADDYSYIPVAYGEKFGNVFDADGLDLGLCLELDIPIDVDLTCTIKIDEDETGVCELFDEEVTIPAGQNSVAVSASLMYRLDMTNDIRTKFSYTPDNSDFPPVGYCDVYYANNFYLKQKISRANVECIFDMNPDAGDEVIDYNGNSWGIAALWDGNPSTFLGTYWNSAGDTVINAHMSEIAVFGVYLDYTAPEEGAAVVNFHYQNRAGNGVPAALQLGYSLDGETFSPVAEITEGLDTANGAWNNVAVWSTEGGMMQKARFGVTSARHSAGSDLRTTPKTSMSMAELEVGIMY